MMLLVFNPTLLVLCTRFHFSNPGFLRGNKTIKQTSKQANKETNKQTNKRAKKELKHQIMSLTIVNQQF